MKTLEQSVLAFIIGSLLLMAIFLLGGCKTQTMVVPEETEVHAQQFADMQAWRAKAKEIAHQVISL